MRPSNSIRWRLMFAAVFTLVAALVAAGWGIAIIFERHVERRVMDELDVDIRQIMSGLSIDAESNPVFAQLPADQRYTQPFGGKYWQIEVGERVFQKSRSLWDEQLNLPDDTVGASERHNHIVAGPRGHTLLAVERGFTVERAAAMYKIVIAAAVESSEIGEAVRSFRTDIATALGFLGTMLLAAFAAAIHVGLEPLSRLRVSLASLRAGTDRRLEGSFPVEISPLVEDLNKVLDQRARIARQAKTRAADLAHGLKTPLTAIEVVADELKGRGEEAIGIELSEYVANMQHHIERELALARSTVADGHGVEDVRVAEVAWQLVRSLRRLPRGDEIDWQIKIPADAIFRGEPAMLMEVIGNLLDNARKWAKQRVNVLAWREGEKVSIQVEDDGPGVPEGELDRVMRRGRRLDETVPGSGFGLAIAKEIVEQVGGRIELCKAPLGGLCARVTFEG